MGGKSYLLAALGDGRVASFVCNAIPLASTTCESSSEHFAKLTEQKVTSLGNKPTTLVPFTSHGFLHVFACSDRPTVIHATAGKLRFSNVDLTEVSHMTPFAADAASSIETYAIVSEHSLIIGTVS